MTEKSLFREIYHTYTNDAYILDGETSRFLKKIFKKYMKKGYNPREISHIIQSATNLIESETILIRNTELRKEKRQK